MRLDIRFPLLQVSLILLTLSLIGCDRGPTEKDGVYKAEVGEIPASPQRPGDPDKGYDALLNRSAVTCGLPYGAYLKTRGAATDAGPQFSGRTGRNAELPYMLTSHLAASGVEVVTSNCLACHASTFNGELVMGLGNEFLDLTVDPLIGIESAAALVEEGSEAALGRSGRRDRRLHDDGHRRRKFREQPHPGLDGAP